MKKKTGTLFLTFSTGFILALACVHLVGTDIDLVKNIPLILGILLIGLGVSYAISKFS